MYNVMIVDDEPNIRNGLKYLINWEKFNFTISAVAKNGKDAIEKMKVVYPDLIITDIKMPGLDGLGLIKYIREKLQDKNMSFIILSGYDDFDYAKEAIKYNVRSYLLKPIDEEELIDILKSINNERPQDNVFEFFYNKRVSEFNEKFNEFKRFDDLVYTIQNNHQAQIEKIIEILFNNFEEISLHPKLIKIHLDNFIIKISTIINDMGGAIENIIKKHNLYETNIVNLNLLQNRLIAFSRECGNYIAELKQSSGIINKVKCYIKNNYSNNLRLKDIARDFYINSAYLGQLFKKETGMNFSQYLNEIRIEKARKLLERTDLHIYQIANQVGYKNSDYFIIKFKEIEKCTPMEYKSRYTQ
ncbi:MAG: response regulator [Halanaerobiales bacterium]